MKEQEQRERIAKDRSFQFSSTKSSLSLSNNQPKPFPNIQTNASWICSNCTYSNSHDASFCVICSHPKVQTSQNVSRLSISNPSQISPISNHQLNHNPIMPSSNLLFIKFTILLIIRLEGFSSKICWFLFKPCYHPFFFQSNDFSAHVPPSFSDQSIRSNLIIFLTCFFASFIHSHLP